MKHLLNITSNFPYEGCPFAGMNVARQIRMLNNLDWGCVTVHPFPFFSKSAFSARKIEQIMSCDIHRPKYLWTGTKIPLVLNLSEDWWLAKSLKPYVRCNILNKMQIDVVICNWIYPSGYLSVEIAKELDVPVILIAHGEDVRRLERMKGKALDSLLASLMNADLIMTYGDALKKSLLEISPKLKPLLMSTDFGVNIDEFCPSDLDIRKKLRIELGLDPNKRSILFVGRWELQKGSKDMTLVMKELVKRYPEWNLVVAGPIIDKQSARDIGDECPIHFLGTILPDQVSKVFKACDAFMLLSHHEGQPNVIKEAMSSGLPVLTYDVGGVSSIVISDENALMVEKGNIEEAYKKLSEICANEDLRERLGKSARCHIVNNYSFSERISDFSTIMLSLIANKKGRRL